MYQDALYDSRQSGSKLRSLSFPIESEDVLGLCSSSPGLVLPLRFFFSPSMDDPFYPLSHVIRLDIRSYGGAITKKAAGLFPTLLWWSSFPAGAWYFIVFLRGKRKAY